MKYSQNDEQEIILKYFEGKPPGRLLEIGAYNSKALSNSRALIELGWEAVLVEPSPRCFSGLMKDYADNAKVKLLNACISNNYGVVEFFDSEGAVATTSREHFEKWNPHQKDFQTIYVPTIPPGEITKTFGNQFDFISIDTEGSDLKILKNMNLPSMGCSCICIEYGADLDEICTLLFRHGFESLGHNGENIICGK